MEERGVTELPSLCIGTTVVCLELMVTLRGYSYGLLVLTKDINVCLNQSLQVPKVHEGSFLVVGLFSVSGFPGIWFSFFCVYFRVKWG